MTEEGADLNMFDVISDFPLVKLIFLKLPSLCVERAGQKIDPQDPPQGAGPLPRLSGNGERLLGDQSTFSSRLQPFISLMSVAQGNVIVITKVKAKT